MPSKALPSRRQAAKTVAPTPSSKIQSVIALLKRPTGTSLDELVQITGWQAHSTRAALTRLRKKGHAIERVKRDGVACYVISGADH